VHERYRQTDQRQTDERRQTNGQVTGDSISCKSTSSGARVVVNIAILDLSKAIARKRCKIGGKLVLISNRKSHMSFRLVPKSVTLNDFERCNGRYYGRPME